MTNLPIFQTTDRILSMLQTSWKAALTPVIQNEINQGILLEGIELTAGDNIAINHLLGRKLIGWQVVDKDAAATIYRSAPLNDLTLTLNSDIDCTIALWVF